MDNKNWTNQQQNEVTFNIGLDARTIKDNMFKNPSLRIELPSQVEKVILGDSYLVYANGLALDTPYLETSENGNLSIVANLTGTQTEYNENTLGLITNVKIAATIILKKDFENTAEKVNLVYSNQYTVDGSSEVGNKELEIQLKTYEEEKAPTVEEPATVYSLSPQVAENANDLKVEVAPVKGNTNISNGDTIYEGEYIKYNIKVTNTSDSLMDSVKLVGSIPEGTTYGELKADYYSYLGEYTYDFDATMTTKEIEIGALKAQESVSKFYEVKVNDLEEGITEKEIISTIKAYVGDQEVSNYELTNLVKPAEVQVFLAAQLDNLRDRWNYNVYMTGEEGKEVTLKLKLPKEYTATNYGHAVTGQTEIKEYFKEGEISEDNVITLNLTVVNGEYYSIKGTMDSSQIETQTENSQVELTAVASVVADNTYQSNENRILYGYESVSIQMTSNKEGEEVKYEEEIDYEITITNTGRTNLYDSAYSTVSVRVTDFLPDNVVPVSMTYDDWIQEVIVTDADGNETTMTDKELNELVLAEKEKVSSYKPTGKFSKAESVTKDISNILTDENGDKLPNVDLYFNIPYGESVTIQIKTTAGFVYEKTKVGNSATVTGDRIVAKTSNTITHTILPYNYEETETPDNPNEPDNPNNPSNPDNPNNPGTSNETYSIAGVAWLDENGDGQRQENEKLLNGIRVLLISPEQGNVIQETNTGTNGSYRFSALNQGNYLVVFKYDANTYSVTEYRKSGVNSEVNSDVTSKNITLQGTQMTAGVTDTITLNASVSNIDIGLVENKICDLKLDKYIQQVVVKTNSGTKQLEYNQSKLAKVEIKAKEIEGASIIVTYKIVVTNEGEVPTTVGKIVDYLPNGLNFSSELNKNWTATRNGELINTSISNKSINAGESIELTLVATKTMTANETGTFTNKAEIAEASNQVGIADIDSTPGNKVESEDDFGKADLIISISTGAVIFYLSMIIITLGIIAILIYVRRKYGLFKIRKLSLFLLVLVTVTLLQHTEVLGVFSQYATTRFSAVWTSSGWQTSSFTGGPDGNGGYCIEHGYWAYTGGYNYSYASMTSSSSSTSTPDVSITLNRLNSQINMKTMGSNYIFGPFQVSSSYNGDYSYSVLDKNGNAISGYSTCDANGNYITVTGTSTFYLKIPINNCRNGISKVKITMSRSGTQTTTTQYYGYLIYKSWGEIYHYGDESGLGTYPTYMSSGTLITSWNCQEVKTNSIFYYDSSSTNTPVSNSKSVEWTDFNGGLEIVKQDADDSDITLEGVEIRVTNSAQNYDKTFTTDAQGKISIQNLTRGTYQITEISNPHYGYDASATGSVNLVGGTITSYGLDNTKKTGNLKINKVDADNSDTKISDVRFRIKNSNEQYIIAIDEEGNTQTQVTGEIYLSNLEYTDEEANATEFITDSEGSISIHNLLIDTYQVIETSVGDNMSYDVDDEYITWSYNGKGSADTAAVAGKGNTAKITLSRKESYHTAKNDNLTEDKFDVLEIENKRKYVKLSGYAWEDLPGIDKQTTQNEYYKNSTDDSNDQLLAGITVQLKDKDGNVIQEMKTGEDGEYRFDYVEIDKLDQYYIEFQYNGMSYQNVKVEDRYEEQPVDGIAYAEKQNGNRVAEGSNREQFNSEYETITYGKSNAHELTYETSQYKSELVYGDESQYNYGYEGNEENRAPITGVDEQYIIRANTRNAYQNENREGYLDCIKTAEAIRSGGIDEITNINLGLMTREMPDLSLVKDLDSVKVSINGAEHVYRYADRFNPAFYADYDVDNGYNVEPAVRFGTKYGSMSYSRALYASDIYYNDTENPDNNLKVEVTYKIGIRNESATLKAVINELTDYYDEKYQLIAVGTDVNEDGSIKGTELHHEVESSEYQEYQKIKIDANLEVSQTEGFVYVQLEVIPEDIATIVETNSTLSDEEVKLDNVVEITSYSIKNQNGDTYAGIDVDSQPGNLDIEDTDTYEDDTDKAPGLKLVLQEERTVSGQVFVDKNITGEELNLGEIRQGNGIFDENEDTITGVDVKLVNPETGETAKVYNGTEWIDAVTETKDNGEYTIGGFIPDNYKIVYTWGDKTYKVQDYKSTIVDKASYDVKGSDENNLEWYKDEFKKNYPNVEWSQVEDKEIRVSDAVDNYTTRQAIDEQSNLVTNSNQAIIDNYSGEIEQKDGSTQTLITKMDSTTPTFRVNVEYDTIQTNASEEDSMPKSNLENVDFGIAERARQVLELSKVVKNAKIILANGTVLINANIIRDETTGEIKIEDNVKHATYIPESTVNGQIKFELDTELTQSATLEIEYALQVSNISELEYLNSNYYLYGEGYGQNDNQLVGLNASNVIDYLDSNIRLEMNEDEIGEIIDGSTRKQELIDQGLLENTEEMKAWLAATNEIVLTSKLSKELKPIGTQNADTKTEELTLIVNKLLATASSDDETILDNDAEIIKTEKTGGSSIITTPGNYVPSLTSSEYDDDKAESVLIVPPTGLNTNYIAYTILAISSLGILIAGIILIKKFVLR